MTKTLETLVLPVLKSAPFTNEMSSNGNTISFTCAVPQFTSTWQVIDHTKPQVLAIEALDLVLLPTEATAILEQVNELSHACFGKFSVVKSPISLSPELGYLLDRERLTYCLELPYSADTTPAAFQHALFLALDTVATKYESWRKAADGFKEKGLFDRIKDAFG